MSRVRVIKETHPVHGVSFNVQQQQPYFFGVFNLWKHVGSFSEEKPALDHYEMLLGRQAVVYEPIIDSIDEPVKVTVRL